MPATVVPAKTAKRINLEFVRRYQELHSRLSRIARGFRDRDEILAELAGFAYLNFRSVFLRRGACLTPGAMAYVAWKRALSGRTVTRNSVRDVHSALAQRRKRVRVVYLSQLSSSRRIQALGDTVVERIVGALSTGEREQPDVRAQVRLDWRAFAHQLPTRMQRILHWLTIGARKNWIARRLGISAGRLSQLLADLGREIAAFFGRDIVPGDCAG